MRRQRMAIIGMLLATGLLLSGCVRKAAVRPPAAPAPPKQQAQAPPPEEDAGPPRTPTSVKMEKPAVKVVDPKGLWTFKAQAVAMTLASARGPYTMQQATGVYERKGQPPIQMKADRIVVDERTRRVTLTGSVHLESPTMAMDAPRVVYDLDTEQVHATGPTKGAYGGPAVAGTAENPPGADRSRVESDGRSRKRLAEDHPRTH